jgi:hypothetical protein
MQKFIAKTIMSLAVILPSPSPQKNYENKKFYWVKFTQFQDLPRWETQP